MQIQSRQKYLLKIRMNVVKNVSVHPETWLRNSLQQYLKFETLSFPFSIEK